MKTSNRIRAALCAAGLTAALAGAEPCSPADLNEDGFVDFSDYLEFLTLFDAMDPRVDYTGDGVVDFADYLAFLNHFDAGCLPVCSTTALDLAANPLGGFPFADFVQAYLTGTPVSVAVDPFKLPGLTGKATRVYITTNQTWTSGMPLADVRAGGFQAVAWPGGSVTASTFALTSSSTLPFDAGEDIGVAYDLVIDENANGVFDGCDIVDGAGAEGGFYTIRDLTTANAGTPVTTVPLVKLPADRVVPGFDDQRWYYPSNIASRGKLPLITISQAGGVIYTWYDHLGQHLASYGYIVMSGETNDIPTAINCSTSTLDHINSLIALQATLGGGVLNGHIDDSEIYLIGQSRAGEGVAFARDRLARGLYTPTGGHARVVSADNIKFIQAIAPTDFNGGGGSVGGGTAFSDPGPTDFMLLWGASDGDVCGCPGASTIAWSFVVFERADARRNSVYIHGADHGDFNCCGFSDFTGPAGTEIGRPAAQALQKALTLAAIKHWRQGNVPSGEVLWRQYESFKPGSTLATATVDYEFKDVGPARKFVIDDYQTETGSGTSSSGGAVSFDVTNLTEGQLRDTNTSYAWVPTDPFNGMSRARAADPTRGVVFDYDSTGPSRSVAFDIVPAGRDTTPYSFISFRAAQGTQHPLTAAVLGDQMFDVELEDGAGHTSAIRISAYGGGIEEVYQRASGGQPGWQNEFETVRIRLGDFTAHGHTLDLSDIVRVRFLFGSAHGTGQDRLALDDIEFVK